MATSAFTGADGTQLPTYDANWTTTGNSSAGSFLLLSNGVTSPLSASTITLFNSYTGSFSNNQSSQLTITQLGVTGEYLGVAVRVTSGNGYVFYVDGGGWFLQKTVASVLSSVTSGSRTQTNGDVVKLIASGTSLIALINGAVISSVTDSSLASGNPGLSSLSLNASGTRIIGDDWIGADYTTRSGGMLLTGVG